MNDWILITGSSKGLGRELALVFAENGYNIIIHGRDEEKLMSVKEDILKIGVECELILGDIKLNQTIESLSYIAKEKNISILVNNAGIGFSKSFEETNEKEFKEVIETNLFSIIKLTKKVYDIFLKKNDGIIININTMNVFSAGENLTAYCSSKHGLKGFTDTLRFDSKSKGIRVMGIYLNGMKTDMYIAGGKDASKCMDPKEVAQTILESCKKKNSLMVDNVFISRMKY